MAFSIPAFKPLLESQQSSNGADMVSVYLNRARIRAAETGRPCGVLFERFESSKDACVVLRIVEVPPPYGGSSGNCRVTVSIDSNDNDYGKLGYYTWTGSSWEEEDNDSNSNTEERYWLKLLSLSSAYNAENSIVGKIQFNNQGPYYDLLRSGNSFKVYFGQYPKRTYGSTNPASFKIIRQPKASLAKPIGLPQGIVVDLNYSGMESTVTNDGLDDFRDGNGGPYTNVNPSIVFSPNGDVQSVCGKAPNNTVYLCVGRWERTGDNAAYLPDDGLRNFQDMSNYWVTVNPKTGYVNVAKSANPQPPPSSVGLKQQLSNSRAFAKQQQFTE